MYSGIDLSLEPMAYSPAPFFEKLCARDYQKGCPVLMWVGE